MNKSPGPEFGAMPKENTAGMITRPASNAAALSKKATYSYLFKPDWSEMANPRTWVYAMGQAFFSLSLAGSGTVVYGKQRGLQGIKREQKKQAS